MNFGELRDDFRLKLNRRDITPTQVDSYLRASIQRAQRLLRVPAMEFRTVYNVGSDYDRMPIPGNYLKLVSLTFNDENELHHTDLTTALRGAKFIGRTTSYSRDGGAWILAPRPRPGDKVYLVYHVDFAVLNDATDSNWITQVAPDIVVSGALSAACRTYVDPRRDSYEADFIQGITDLNIQATDDELTNAQIAPTHSFDCD